MMKKTCFRGALTGILLVIILFISSCSGKVKGSDTMDSDSSVTDFSFQLNNRNPMLLLSLQSQNNLQDTRIGVLVSNCITSSPLEWKNWIYNLKTDGFTRARFTLNAIDGPAADLANASIEKEIPADYIDLFVRMKKIGIISRYSLSFWDFEHRINGGEIHFTRLDSEEEIQRYLQYVDMVTTSLKGVVDEYEMWNESDANRDYFQRIEPEVYIDVAKRVIPIIRKNDPDAKIVLASTSSYIEPECQAYTMEILQSDLPSMADVISLHTVNNDASPVFHSGYYYNYETMWKDIKETAESHGFAGEYVADELNYRSNYSISVLQPENGPYHPYEPEIAAKYIGRMIAINLGMDISIGTSGTNAMERPIEGKMIRNMAYLLDGWRAKELELTIQTDSNLVRGFTFVDDNGNQAYVIWNDIEAQVESGTVVVDIELPNMDVKKITGIDPYSGKTQDIEYSVENNLLIIKGLIIKDYPTIYQVTTR